MVFLFRTSTTSFDQPALLHIRDSEETDGFEDSHSLRLIRDALFLSASQRVAIHNLHCTGYQLRRCSWLR